MPILNLHCSFGKVWIVCIWSGRSHALLKPRMVSSLWYYVTLVVRERKPLNLHCRCTFKTTIYSDTHTLTHLTGPFSGTTQVSRYQKGKTNLDFTEATDSEWQWHQLGHMQVCTSLQTDNHASTPPLSFFTAQMLFLSPNQQRQSTEGMKH